MDSRQQFEEWVVGRKVVKKHGAKLNATSDGTYCDYRINDRWLAWQASRESLLVDLGSMTNNGYEGFYPANQIKRALRDSGIRTK